MLVPGAALTIFRYKVHKETGTAVPAKMSASNKRK